MYFDAASDRLTAAARRSFNERVDAVRAGMIFAHDNSAYRSWYHRAHQDTPTYSKASSPAALEAHIMSLATSAPRLVALPGQPVRRMRAADVRAKSLERADRARSTREAYRARKDRG